MSKIDKLLVCFIVALLCFVSGAVSYDIAQRSMREQAVVRGYAEWVVNDNGTEVTFVWKKFLLTY